MDGWTTSHETLFSFFSNGAEEVLASAAGQASGRVAAHLLPLVWERHFLPSRSQQL